MGLLEKEKDETVRGKLLSKVSDLEIKLNELDRKFEPVVPESPPEPNPETDPFALKFKNFQKLLWYRWWHPEKTKAIRELEYIIQRAMSDIDGYLEYQEEHIGDLAIDGRQLCDLPVRPEPHTLYVCPTRETAFELSAHGYPATSCTDPTKLNTFLGSDIVLTHPSVFHLAPLLHERFTTSSITCWPGGTLRVLGQVPIQTHFLTLCEVFQLNTRKKHVGLTKMLHSAFGAGDEAHYCSLARKLVAA